MSKEIENLAQMSAKRDVLHSLADKRERQYFQLGVLAQQESLERTVRIGEIMDRTLDRWQGLTEKAEELAQNISTETERVKGLIHRLGDLGDRNPTLKTAFETYKAEFDEWQGSRAPKAEDTAPVQEAEPQEEIIEEGSEITIAKVPAEMLDGGAIEESAAPQEAPTPAITGGKRGYRKEAAVDYDEKKLYVLPTGNEIEITEIRYIILSLLEQGSVHRDVFAERFYPVTFNVNKKYARAKVSALISGFNEFLNQHNLQINNLTSINESRKGKDVEYVLQYYGDLESVIKEVKEKEILQIPPVPELRHIESANPHKYDETLTVAYQLEQAQFTQPADRTPEQKQLLEDIEYLKRFTSSTGYQKVYSSVELHGLVSKLRPLENKDRESFTDVEERLIGHLIQIEKSTSAKYDSPKKSPSSWITLKNRATRVTRYLQAKYGERAEQSRYFMVLKDPNPDRAPRDLSSLYTFAVFDYAIGLIGERTVNVTDQRYANFEANCEAINRWFESAKPLIDRMPDHLKLPTGYTERQRMVGARWFLCDLVETMNIRLKGNGRNRFEGFDKYYRYDVAGAISLQYLIQHKVEQINEMLRHIITEEIVPLESDNV